MKWRIWYDNGTCYDSEIGTPQNAPGLGVICIVKESERTGRVKLSGADYYLWREGQWVRADLFGLWDYMAGRGWKKAVFGRTVPRPQYEAVMQRAEEDTDFPARSAWEPWEHRIG